MSKKRTGVRVASSVTAGTYVGIGALLLLFGMIISMTDETAGSIFAFIGLCLFVAAAYAMRK